MNHRTAVSVGVLTALTALLCACGGPSVAPPLNTAGVAGSSSARPTSATASASEDEQPTSTPEPTPSSAEASTPSNEQESSAPAPSADDGDFSPVWYPDWTENGGKGEAASWPTGWPSPRILTPTGSGPLDGRVVLVDPGHNLGNSTHSKQINREYWVGLTKICNTTGTETRSGYAEATYTFDVAKRLAAKLTSAGATVVLTRDRNSDDTYGPCIQARGLLGGQVGADVGVSIHADGGPAAGRGAFVYTPAELAGFTDANKAAQSEQLASAVLAGLADQGLQGSTYLQPNISPDTEQGTLNTATTPIAIVETLNMRNAADAAIAESASGRQSVADGLYAGIVRYLTG